MDVIESLRLRLTPKTTRLKRKQTRRDPPEVRTLVREGRLGARYCRCRSSFCRSRAAVYREQSRLGRLTSAAVKDGRLMATYRLPNDCGAEIRPGKINHEITAAKSDILPRWV